MQTFIPETTYVDCAAVLDRQRLGKQRVECLQIVNILCDVQPSHRKGWRTHPAVLMWRGYEYALTQYAKAVCDEWTSRGYIDTCLDKINAAFYAKYSGASCEYPEWWGNTDIHRSHQSNLLRKDYDHYSMFYANVPDDLPYVWPVQLDNDDNIV